jgi:A/G-specific adenine glycosylase
MLQQTQAGRVRDRWTAFLASWPTPGACAAAPLPEVLRFWQGLGYPRRARALWSAAAAIEVGGWPRTEEGLRSLPGVGPYTARALLTLAFGEPSRPPLDVNISRVAARAALGAHPREVRTTDIEAAVATGRPRALDARRYTLALFDAGALHCRAVPACGGCPLARRCRWLACGAPPETRPGRRQRYEGTMRQLRGAVLAEQLSEDPPATLPDLVRRVAAAPLSREPGSVALALASLRADGLLPAATER